MIIPWQPIYMSIEQEIHEPWNYGAHDARAFYVFRS